jgi:hypothetical protein
MRSAKTEDMTANKPFAPVRERDHMLQYATGKEKNEKNNSKHCKKVVYLVYLSAGAKKAIITE